LAGKTFDEPSDKQMIQLISPRLLACIARVIGRLPHHFARL